ncbi:MAG: exodeoxyribonuclease VII large subunit [Pseudomonadota bacterium]
MHPASGASQQATGPGRVWTVGALLLATGDALAARFGAVAVQGELSGFARAASGHCYFGLKDGAGGSALLRCAMFRRAAALLDFAPADGQQVELRGRLGVYEARGELQLVVESMRRLGAGALYEEFLRRRARLEAEGLFDAARKRPLPAFPRRIGVVTSLAAAALRDVAIALARRAPQVEVVVYPAPVQGPDAPAALAEALRLAAQRAEVDLLLLVRGGGSLEDLWAFNDERVVRAVAASPLPLVCGVGHETDVTLADLAADLRAPTPTAAAELAAPAAADLLQGLDVLQARRRRAVQRALAGAGQRLDNLALRLGQPARLVLTQRGRLDALARRRALEPAPARARGHERVALARLRLGQVAALALQRRHAALESAAARLQALDPARVLQRGYAWVEDASGRPVPGVAALQPGQRVQAVWADGRAAAHIEEVQPQPPGAAGTPSPPPPARRRRGA